MEDGGPIEGGALGETRCTLVSRDGDNVSVPPFCIHGVLLESAMRAACKKYSCFVATCVIETRRYSFDAYWNKLSRSSFRVLVGVVIATQYQKTPTQGG